jgi:hypothetical protein
VISVDRKMNLVVPVENADGSKTYVHSMPIARETFERYHLAISKTFAAIYHENLGPTAGPRVAALMLRSIAEKMGAWEYGKDGTPGVEAGLMSEIRRLSNVIALTPSGWAPIPLQEALDKNLISEDDKSEVENAIVFFIVASAMHLKREIAAILNGVAEIWDAQITLLSVSEFARSLPTSKGIEDSGKKAA